MTALIVQADDAAISHATTLGILAAIDAGAITAVGVFSNQPDAPFAAAELRRRSRVDVGLDLNFVSGRPLLPPADVPGLVGEHGMFRSSSAIKADGHVLERDGAYWTFEREPFDEDQVRAEAEAQLARFIELFDRLPAYLHHHSLVTPVTDRVLQDLACEHGILAMDELYRSRQLPVLPNDWYSTPFGLAEQAAADPSRAIERLVEGALRSELSVLITHPGYVDAELLDLSTYSVVRARDLQLLLSREWAGALHEAGISLVTFREAGLC